MKKIFLTQDEKDLLGGFLCCIAFCSLMFLAICICY